ncbi:MAG: D-alanyl-D-alanine carboxypeptidase [Turicibacter sp.]|nr:D-alanyl-D-alanine carboxypeptidase [Turicibacter sp.]
MDKMIMNDDEINRQKEEQRLQKKENFTRRVKLIRNVILAGIVAGIGIHVAVNWEPPVPPTKVVDDFSRDVRTVWIEELLRPLRYSEVTFEMYSNQALLINLSNGRILFSHHADEITYPASVTKIMTVLIGIEHSEMDESVVIQADFDALWWAGAMLSGFGPGEVRSMSDILHGIMLPSGAEASSSLAYHIAGGEAGFVALMNEKAEELGMTNTHFMNTTGLHDDNHYTTAEDIAILLTYALENPEFRAIFTAQTYELAVPNSLGHTMLSTLFNTIDSNEFEGGAIIGGRTGFTFEAGRCLASLATNGEDEFILITFGTPTPDLVTNATAHILDALLIHEYFFNLHR